ncbi:DNA cytosine methyltransferase [Halomonas sp. H5]|uniref:DNA cytosine methyltransferase n=1 Tax=Halomonas sp. H5 TaxID=3423910 RepID=UPI003D36CECE
MSKPIQIVDLFAGPGGLGEGFNSLRDAKGGRIFKTLVSVEKEASAHRTLTLRAFYRLLQDSHFGMESYFEYLRGGEHPSKVEELKELWEEATQEALRLELGGEAGHKALDERLDNYLDQNSDWVLIGGPPCQAYSVVGRVRNRGNKSYVAEEDKRHFLYREYLDVIARYRPSVFVMENVKGILTSKVGKERIFRQILKDLEDPTEATRVEGEGSGKNQKYTIFSLSDPDVYHPQQEQQLIPGIARELSDEELSGFVVKSEEYGIPQTRHRVILIGVRKDIVDGQDVASIAKSLILDKKKEVSSGEVLFGMPKLRSGLSRGDSDEDWYSAIRRVAEKIAGELIETESESISPEERNYISCRLREIVAEPKLGFDRGRKYDSTYVKVNPVTELEKWYAGEQNGSVRHWVNHDARGHMEEDLARYLYCSVFAEVTQRSPIGVRDIYLESLAPMHVNWKSGKFADRFKVVVSHFPSKTITSHISKDGHYYIHPDPYQCRSLTVREAARLQTFPDDYYFEGNRTEQYVQVGNAVPPLLAAKIAEKVRKLLDGGNITPFLGESEKSGVKAVSGSLSVTC